MSGWQLAVPAVKNGRFLHCLRFDTTLVMRTREINNAFKSCGTGPFYILSLFAITFYIIFTMKCKKESAAFQRKRVLSVIFILKASN